MTYNVQAVQRLRVKKETNGNFCVDQTSQMSTFTDIPIREGSTTMTLDQAKLDPMNARQYIYAHNTEILGAKSSSIAFEVNLGPTDTIAADGATAAQTPAGLLLGLTMGGETTCVGTTANAEQDEDSVTIADNISTTKHSPGGAIGWVNANSKLELRELQSASGTQLTTKVEFSGVPATGNVIYACRTYYLDNRTSSDVGSLQAVLEGFDPSGVDDCWVHSGGQIDSPMAITFTNGEIPTLGFNFKFADWDNGDDKALTPITLGANEHATYNNQNEICVLDSEFICGEVANATYSGVERHITSFEIELGYKYIPIKTPGGTNNIVQWAMMPDHPVVKGSFTIPYEDQTFKDYEAAKTPLYIFFQIGSTTSEGAMLISIPTIQVTNVQRIDNEGIASQKVEFIGRQDADVGSIITAQALSPFRIHIF